METATANGEVQDQPLEAQPTSGPRGIGGWLVLPIMHLITSIVFTGINVFPVWQNWSGLFNLLLDPANRWMFLPIVVSTVLSMAIISLAACALTMMFLRKRILPWLMICFYIGLLLGTLLDWALYFYYPEFREIGADDLGQARNEFTRAFFAALIWIPYFLISKRVKATFVE
jgi:hypothetical protein